MTNTSRERQRQELHSAIWSIAKDLRGSVDGWDFKQYVLGMLFYRFLSEQMVRHAEKNEHDARKTDFKYSELTDSLAIKAKADLVNTLGYFIQPGHLFVNVLKSADPEKLNEKLQEVFRGIEGSANGGPSEKYFRGLFDDFDLNSNKLGPTVIKRNERLLQLMNGIAAMPVGDFNANAID